MVAKHLHGLSQGLTGKISFKYVTDPKRAQFVDIKRSTTNSNDDSTYNLAKEDGLGTNLHPTTGCGPDDNIPALRKVEASL